MVPLRQAAAFFLLLTGLAAGVVHADEGAGDGITISVEGKARTAPELRQREREVRAELAKLAETPAGDDAVHKELIEAMTAQAAAFSEAAALIERIPGGGGAETSFDVLIDKEKALLTELQGEAARAVVVEGEVDEDRVKALEVEAAKALQAITEAERRVAEVEKQKPPEASALEARQAELETRRAKLATELEATKEDATREREILTRQIVTNEVRRGMLALRQAHRAALLQQEARRGNLAQVQVQVAKARRTIADARLAEARKRYQKRLAEAAESARRKEAEAREALRIAELFGTPAGKAITRLELLRTRMQSEQAADEKLTSTIEALRDESDVQARAAATRLESVRLLFPAGEALEPWQQDGLAERLRQLEQDRADFEAFRANEVPDLNALLAEGLVRRGRLELFTVRLDAAQDRLARGESEDARIAAIEREIAQARDADYQLWLEARRDFLRGQTQLRREDVEDLRERWNKNTAILESAIRSRTKELEKQKASAEKLKASLEATDSALLARRRHLDRAAFWLRGDPLLASATMARVRAEFGTVGTWVAALPRRFEQLEPAATTPAWLAVLFAILVIAGGVWLRRAPPGAAIPPATSDLPADVADAEARRAQLRRGWVVVGRRIFLPLGLFLVALYLLRVVFPSEPLVAVLVAVLGAWLARRVSMSISRTFLTPGADGRCLAGCEAQTAARVRLCMRLLFQTSGILFAVVVICHAADAPNLARWASFIWGLSALLVSVLLVIWRDALLLIVPAKHGGLIGRTVFGAVRLLLPLLVLLGAGLLAMYVFGYRRASAFYGSRALLLLAALGTLAVVHGLVKLWVQARFARPEPESETTPDRVDLHLGERLAGALITVGALVGAALAVSFILGMTWADWEALAAISVTGASGEGLTLGRIARAVLLFVVTLGLARYLRDVVRLALRSSNLHMGSRYAVRTLLFYTLVFVGTLMALSALGVRMDQFGWFLTAAGVGIGFGLQEIISNFISGLILFFERPVQVGDIISVGNVEGDVTRISIRSTVVRTRDGVSIILPNKKLITEDVVNWSHGEQRTRLNLPVGVAYGSDVELVRKLLLEIAAGERLVVSRPAPEVDFTEFADSALIFTMRLWLATPDITARRRVRNSVYTRVDKAFAEHGITIPFPQRDLHLRSSNIGGLSGAGESPPET